MGDKTSPRVGLFGPFGFGNLGDAAIQEAMIHHLEENFPEASIYGFSLNPNDTKTRHAIDSYPIGVTYAEHLSILDRVPKRFRRYRAVRIPATVLMKIPAELKFFRLSYRILGKLDSLIISGGGQLNDFKGFWKHPYTLLKWAAMARFRDVDVQFVSVGAGPISSRIGKLFIRAALALASYRSYRDETSKRYVRSIGFKNDDDPVYPDLAYSLPLEVLGMGENERRSDNGSPPAPVTVGIGPVPYFASWYWPESVPAFYSEYLSKLSAFIDWLISQEYRVLLFPNQTGADLRVIEDLTAMVLPRVPHPKEQILTPAISSLDDLFRTISMMDMVISSRLHGVILSQIMGKPVLALSCHPKITSLMEDLDQSGYCLDIQSFEVSDLIRRFQQLEANRTRVLDEMSEKLAANRQRLSVQYENIFSSMR